VAAAHLEGLLARELERFAREHPRSRALAREAEESLLAGVPMPWMIRWAGGFPVFAAGIKPVDSMGRGWVTAYNVPVECGEVVVHPGDFVFADFDGVVVVPQAIVKDVMEMASDKVRREDSSRAELMQGAYLRDVFKKYGVL